MTAPTPLLEVRNLEVVYSDVILVLRGISLTVPAGAVVSLLGANGAGKTTLLRAVSGLLDVHRGDITKGSVAFDGAEIHTRTAPEIGQRRASPQGGGGGRASSRSSRSGTTSPSAPSRSAPRPPPQGAPRGSRAFRSSRSAARRSPVTSLAASGGVRAGAPRCPHASSSRPR
ncbi:MAG: ATP-binding cassette domain-containing protein [Gemmatimonadetes bacterium]|nr:ATP-binding cassette domain-containing protein [Gemmatimonadota bacterium]